MSYLLMGAQLASGIADGVSSYFASKAQAKFMEQTQAFNNRIVNLSNANNQDALTEQSIQVRDASARDAVTIQMQRMEAHASAEVAAATAGVAGNSVNLTMMDISRNAARAEHLRRETLKSHYISNDQQRRNSQFGAFTSQDRSYIPKPSVASAALGIAGTSFQTVKQYYPDLGNVDLTGIP
jgi:hypothetical protein